MKERLMDLRLREEQISISSASTVYLTSTAMGSRGAVASSTSSPPGNRRLASSLVARYGELYSQARLETLDALDDLMELANADELKNKLLFSVVVVGHIVSFASTTHFLPC